MLTHTRVVSAKAAANLLDIGDHISSSASTSVVAAFSWLVHGCHPILYPGQGKFLQLSCMINWEESYHIHSKLGPIILKPLKELWRFFFSKKHETDWANNPGPRRNELRSLSNHAGEISPVTAVDWLERTFSTWVGIVSSENWWIFNILLEDFCLFVWLYWRLEFLFCSINSHQITFSISLGIALHRRKLIEQVFVRQDNISLSDMPATGKLGPMSHYTNKLFECILDRTKLPHGLHKCSAYATTRFSCAPRQYCGKHQLQFYLTTNQTPLSRIKYTFIIAHKRILDATDSTTAHPAKDLQG